jgi:hypothetical protein
MVKRSQFRFGTNKFALMDFSMHRRKARPAAMTDSEEQCGGLFRTPSSLSRSFLSAAPLVLAVSRSSCLTSSEPNKSISPDEAIAPCRYSSHHSFQRQDPLPTSDRGQAPTPADFLLPILNSPSSLLCRPSVFRRPSLSYTPMYLFPSSFF